MPSIRGRGANPDKKYLNMEINDSTNTFDRELITLNKKILECNEEQKAFSKKIY